MRLCIISISGERADLVCNILLWGHHMKFFYNNRIYHSDWQEKFLERIIGQAMRYVQPSKRVELSPQEAILVFQEFYIQHAVITYSPPLASFIRNNYTEEFKWVLFERLTTNKGFWGICYCDWHLKILLRRNIMGVDLLDQFIEEMNPNCS